MRDSAPNAAQWLILVGIALVGVWYIIRGTTQFRHPQDVSAIGLGWLVRLSHLFAPQGVSLEEFWANPRTVRLFALGAILAGVGLVTIFVAVLVVSRLQL